MQPMEQWVSPSSVPQGLQISFIKVIVSFPGHKRPFILVRLFFFRLSHMNHIFFEDFPVRTSLVNLVIFFTIDESKLFSDNKKIQRHASMVTYTLRSDLTSSSFSSWMSGKCEILTWLSWSIFNLFGQKMANSWGDCWSRNYSRARFFSILFIAK